MQNKAAGFSCINGIKLRYMQAIVATLKHLLLNDLMVLDKRFSLIPLIMESSAIIIVFFFQGYVSLL